MGIEQQQAEIITEKHVIFALPMKESFFRIKIIISIKFSYCRVTRAQMKLASYLVQKRLRDLLLPPDPSSVKVNDKITFSGR